MTLTDESLAYAAQTAVGRVREHNEDALLCSPELSLWAVADGMGGHQRGEVASAIALETLREAAARGADLLAAIHAANAAVIAAAGQDSGARGMGTTLVAVRFAGADFEVAWVGDSRAYRVSAESIVRLSRDHSWVQAMVDAGEMSADEARSDPRRNIVLQCIGQTDQALEVGLVQGRLEPDELLLLCSDGLTGELTDRQIQQLCATASTLDGLVAQLIELANQLGGKDNISCIVLGRSVAEAPVVEARPRSFLSKLLKPRKH